MRAAVRVKYGPPGEVLSIKEIEKPDPKGDELLINVYASSANRTDYHVLTGKPNFMRLFTGLSKPRLTITGSDFAGKVEAISVAVHRPLSLNPDIPIAASGSEPILKGAGLSHSIPHRQRYARPSRRTMNLALRPWMLPQEALQQRLRQTNGL